MKKLSIVIVALLVLTSCGKVTTEEIKPDGNSKKTEITTTTKKEVIKEKAFGGTLNVCMSKPETLNAVDNTAADVAQVLSLVYEPLFMLDEHEKPVGVLAKSYEFGDEGRSLTITLKDGIKFHNGMPFTAYDVKYTIDYIKLHQNSPYNYHALPIRRVSIIDEMTFKLWYDEPYGYALLDLSFPIISSEYVKSGEYDPNMPVGTGPYKFSSFQPTQFLDLTANREYREEVYIENIHSVIMQSTSEMTTLFDKGLVDIMNPRVFDWLKYSEDENNRIFPYPSRNMTFLGYNSAKSNILTSEVKKAIMYAVDRENLAYKQYINKVTPTDTPVLINAYYNGTNDLKYPYDVEKAKELLTGVSEESPLMVKLLVNADIPNNLKVANFIKENLKDVNIELEIEEATKDVYFERIQSKNYEIFLGNIKLTNRPDYTSLFASEGVQNFVGYSNDTMDIILDSLVHSNNDDDLKSNINNFKALFVEELPYGVLFFHEGAVMISSKVKGDFKPTGDFMIYNIKNLYIEEK